MEKGEVVGRFEQRDGEVGDWEVKLDPYLDRGKARVMDLAYEALSTCIYTHLAFLYQ